MTQETVQRKYALRRVGTGDYLLVSNDGQTLWRIRRYTEDGSLERSDGTRDMGTYWMTFRYDAPITSWQPGHVDDWSLWIGWDFLLKTREEAIGLILQQAPTEQEQKQ